MQKMPITFKWLQSILVAPVNFGPGESTVGYIGAGTPPATTPVTPATTAMNTDTAITPAITPATTPATTTVPPTTVAGVNLCTAPANQLVAILCQLSNSLGSGGAGLTLTVGDEMILPTVGQFLTAFDTYLMMAKLNITEKEAKSVKVYLDKALVQSGIEKDPYSGAQDIYSTKFKVPTEMTPTRDFKIMKLALYLDDKLLVGTPVKVSRNSLCGDLGEFKKGM